MESKKLAAHHHGYCAPVASPGINQDYPAETLLRLALTSPEQAKERFSNYRLTQLVVARFDMNDAEASVFSRLSGQDEYVCLVIGDGSFDEHLRKTITQFGLWPLFTDDGPGRYHHAIRPKGYDYYADMIDAEGMERWRADYRAMSAARQMLAASIVWLYRGGKDNRWLRRVPCTWHAADAVAVMDRSGVLSAWGVLIALYPGW